MKTLVLGVGFGARLSLSALTTPAQTNQKPAEAAAANALALRQLPPGISEALGVMSHNRR